MYKRIRRVRQLFPSASLVIEQQEDVFAPIKQELSKYILMESIHQEMIFCMGYVLTQETVRQWTDADPSLKLSFSAHEVHNLHVQHIPPEADDPIYKKSVARRAELIKLNPPSTSKPHPAIAEFTKSPTETTALVRLCDDVIRIWQIKDAPKFTKHNGTIHAEFIIGNGSIHWSDLKELRHTRWTIHVHDRRLYLTIQSSSA
jgi:hypothetical protein